ncbi:hypothetical protein L873DRAFT_1845829 [Choiromyces venosus 120613-1]|uniref:SWIM-type domain-containing protein n=1 Tax=Choiromyces venosus 120613-1 TaxID=1336337 RepID=A0A3N4JEK7_9PEZI|nr:hypothetical protein L873DRAFT_1845829 [Choiromyces venosus 120613-1]
MMFYEVHLAHAWCSYSQYQENGVPCGHALACIYYLEKEPSNYMPKNLSINTFQATYENHIWLIDITPLLTTFDANLEDLELNYTSSASGERASRGLLMATLDLSAEALRESESQGIPETTEFQE